MKLRPGILLVFALFILTSFSSCVHEYICQCTISYSGQAGLPDTVVHEYKISDTKKKARATCKSNSYNTDRDGIHADESCDLY
jgi:hypothetical protein